MIIGAIVLGLIIQAVYPDAYSSPGKLWSRVKQEVNQGKTEFTPYVDVLTVEEQIADESMRALSCGLSSAVLSLYDSDFCSQNLGVLTEVSTTKKTTGAAAPQKEETCKGYGFGKRCVTCAGRASITLEGDATKDAHSIAQSLDQCYGLISTNKNKNVVCAEIVDGLNEKLSGLLSENYDQYETDLATYMVTTIKKSSLDADKKIVQDLETIQKLPSEYNAWIKKVSSDLDNAIRKRLKNVIELLRVKDRNNQEESLFDLLTRYEGDLGALEREYYVDKVEDLTDVEEKEYQHKKDLVLLKVIGYPAFADLRNQQTEIEKKYRDWQKKLDLRDQNTQELIKEIPVIYKRLKDEDFEIWVGETKIQNNYAGKSTTLKNIIDFKITTSLLQSKHKIITRKNDLPTAGTFFGDGLRWDMINKEKFLSPGIKKRKIYLIWEGEGVDNFLITDKPLLRGVINKPFSCKIKAFELPQDFAKYGYADENGKYDAWIQGTGDPEFVLFYEQFPKGEEVSWQASAWSISTNWIIFSSVMNAGPLKLLKGGGKLLRAVPRQSFRLLWKGSKNTFKFGLEKLTAEQADKVVSETISAVTEKGVKEVVYGKSIRSVLSDIGSLITNMNIPLNAEQFLRRGLLQETITSHLGKVSDDFSRALDTLIQEIGEKATRAEVDEVVEKLTRKYATDLENLFLKKKGLDKNAVNNLAKNLFEPPKRIPANALSDGVYEAALAAARKEAVDKAQKEIFGDSLEKFTNDIAGELSLTAKLTKEELQSLQGLRSLMRNLLEGGSKFNDEILGNMIKDALTHFPKSAKLQKNAFERMTRISLDLIDSSTGRLNLDKIAGRSLSAFEREAFEESFMAATVKNSLFSGLSDSTLKALWKNMFGTEVNYATWKGFLRSGWKAGRNLVPIATPSFRYDIVGAGAPFFIGTALKVADWPFQHKYFTAALLAYYASYMDSMDEKSYPHGINSLYLSQPRVVSVGKSYDLPDHSSPFFINLVKDDKGTSRFFAASPCKVDFAASPVLCSCTLQRHGLVIKLDSGLQPLQFGSLIGKDPEKEDVFPFDQLKRFERPDIIKACLANDECGDTIGSNIGGLYNEVFEFVYDTFYQDALAGVEQFRKGLGELKISDSHAVRADSRSLSSGKQLQWFTVKQTIALDIMESFLYPPGTLGLHPEIHFSDADALNDYLLRRFTNGPDYSVYSNPERGLANYVIVPALRKMVRYYYSNQPYADSKLSAFFDLDPDKGLMGKIMRYSYKHYQVVSLENLDSLDKGSLVKECIDQELISSSAVFDKIQNGPVFDNIQVSAPCVIVESAGYYPSYNQGSNYCYSSKTGRNAEYILRGLNLGLFVAFDVGAVALGGPFGFAVVFVTGGVQEYFDQWITRTSNAWPAHTWDVPSAETKEYGSSDLDGTTAGSSGWGALFQKN
ncbi:MAG: hypothetical protein O2779_05140 [Nanoarchaeota archaeon]|nr:hypothetical protein [Nanoarchaeota archaeon]